MRETSVTVCLGRGGDRDAAASLARKLGVGVSDAPGDELTVLFDKNGTSLEGYGLTYRGDFTEMLHRLTEGRLAHEMLVHVSKSKDTGKRAADATAGMGEDSLLLAAAGYDVTLFEKDPVIAALLRDAIRRAKRHPVLGETVSRMHVIEGDSVKLMPSLCRGFDLIYLDPMFPARQKSGLINKKLQLIQKLELPCSEEAEMLEAALGAAPKKIVIKRPLKGPYLAGREPGYSVKGKAIRYDCIVVSG